MPACTIIPLNPTDTKLALQLIALWQSEDFNPAGNIPSEFYLTTILANPAVHTLVALQEGVVVGGCTAYALPMLTTQTTELFLYDIMVHPTHQRQGIGSNLIRRLIDIGRNLSISAMYVPTEPANAAARALYRQTGGTEENLSWFTYTL